MNRKMIVYTLGKILLVEALLMIPAAIVSLVYGEGDFYDFLIPMALLIAIGTPMCVKKPDNTAIYSRDGIFIVAAAWILMSLFGALPFLFCGKFASFWDCIFEVVSGFTTTGASILQAPEVLPHGVLFWRSFTHWIGGMGVLVFVLAILPLSDERSMHLIRAEVPGPTVGKLVPKMKSTSRILYGIYMFLTALLVVLLLFGGMPLFDSFCYAFGTAGTGGFATHSAGFAVYGSAYIEYIIGIFMLLFGINFNLYYFILIKKFSAAYKSEELRWYFGIVLVSVVLILINVGSMFASFADGLRHSFFQVSTIITTTGFSTVDFDLWPEFSRHLLVLLMIIGSCAGSTAGGLKMSRVALLLKSLKLEIKRIIHPRSVNVVHFDGKPVDDRTLSGVRIYVAAYFAIVLATVLLLSIDGFDFVTNVTAEIACFNNIGPGLAAVGPTANYGGYSAFSKMLLSFNMLLGRLEIFPMLVILSPRVWKKNVN